LSTAGASSVLGRLRAGAGRLNFSYVVLVVLVVLVAAGSLAIVGEREAVYRQVVVQQVANQVPRAGDDEQIALALFDEILRIGALDPDDLVIDDDAAGTLIRGFGYCDSIAMAFVQVAERLGFEGQLVFLQNAETGGTSPHTVATLKLDGEWRVFDVLYRAIARDHDGEIATAADIAAGRSPVTSPLVQASWFAHPQIAYQTATVDGLRGRAKSAVSSLVAFLPSPLIRVAQDAYLRATPPTYVETDGKVWEEWQDPSDVPYWKARNYDVFRRFDLARPLYEQVAADRSSAHATSAEVFLRQIRDPNSLQGFDTATSGASTMSAAVR
jgi:hypothetical protein